MREENDRDQFQHTHSHLHGHDEDGSHSHDHGHGHHTPQKSSRFETNKNEYVFDENRFFLVDFLDKLHLSITGLKRKVGTQVGDGNRRFVKFLYGFMPSQVVPH